MSELKTYQFHGKYGITDLKGEDPYCHGDGQWPYFESALQEWNEERYLANPDLYRKLVRTYNETYIAELKSSGKYGQEFTIDISMKYNPLFDKPMKVLSQPLESHRLYFINFD